MSEPVGAGIDVAKDTLEVAWGVQSASFDNDVSGHDALSERLRSQGVELVLMEASSSTRWCEPVNLGILHFIVLDI